jgi:3-hydroxyisobutyrate dehydrogenase and related beta-hydroxyacid dehydrogenases
MSSRGSGKETLGFIGVGAMGLPMATNLLAAGFPLRVYNRTAHKAAPLAEQGATVCESPAEVAEGAGIVLTILADDAAVEAVTLGEEGLLDALEPGGLHLSMSTISPATAKRLAQLHDLHDTVYLGAPVFGRPDAAAAKGLRVLVSGGDAAVRERVRPVLEALGNGVFDFGDDPAAAHVVKVCGNFLIGAAIEAMAEGYTLAEKNGVDRQAFHDFLTQTIFACAIHQNYGKLVAAHAYEPAGFTVPLGLKDATLARDLAWQSQTPLPLAGIVQDRLLAARAKGRDTMDWACLALESSEAAGLLPPGDAAEIKKGAARR